MCVKTYAGFANLSAFLFLPHSFFTPSHIVREILELLFLPGHSQPLPDEPACCQPSQTPAAGYPECRCSVTACGSPVDAQRTHHTPDICKQQCPVRRLPAGSAPGLRTAGGTGTVRIPTRCRSSSAIDRGSAAQGSCDAFAVTRPGTSTLLAGLPGRWLIARRPPSLPLPPVITAERVLEGTQCPKWGRGKGKPCRFDLCL